MPITVVFSDFIDALVHDPVLNANPAIDATHKRISASDFARSRRNCQTCTRPSLICTVRWARAASSVLWVIMTVVSPFWLRERRIS